MRTFAATLLLGTLASGCAREGHAEERAPSAPSTTATAAAAPEVASAAPEVAPAAPEVPAGPVATDSAAPAPTASPTAQGACPEGMARLGRFCIDRWEAHLAARSAEGVLTALPHSERPPADGAYEAESEPGTFPQGYISRVEAATACQNAGKRLCSMDEWQRACEGSRGTTYPYGEHWLEGRCNMDKGHVLTLRYGPESRKWTYEAFNDPALDREPGFLEKTGSYPSCTSDAGVYDMVGNVHEWVSDTVDDALMERLAAEPVERKHQGFRPGNGVFMGGFFSTHEQLGPGCKYVTVAHEPTYHDYSTGFRCCKTAPPAKKPKSKSAGSGPRR